VLVPELDAGRILFQQRVPIGPHDTVGDLYARLNDLQRARLASIVERHLDGDQGWPQDESAATYGCTRLPADGEIDWTRPTNEVYAVVRALGDPYPGAFTHLDGRRLVLWRAAPAPSPRRWVGRVPGRVVGRSATGGWVDVLTGDGVLRLDLVERDGEARRPAAAVIRSVRTTLGLRPAELLARVRELEDALARARPYDEASEGSEVT
jgi:methionyl-tRNA formyltransferase